MENDIMVSIDNISNLQKKIESKGTELLEILSTIMNENDRINEIYDSPTATIYREHINLYLEDRINYIENNYLSLVEILESIKNVYQDEINNISNMVGE